MKVLMRRERLENFHEKLLCGRFLGWCFFFVFEKKARFHSNEESYITASNNREGGDVKTLEQLIKQGNLANS